MNHPNSWRKATVGVSLAAALALTVSACSTTDSTSKSSSDKTMTYWSMWTETEPQAQVLKTSIAAFEKESGIKVDVQWQGRKVLDKVSAGILSGDVPDLVDQGFDTLGQSLQAANQLTDLSSVLTTKVPGESTTVGDVIPKKYLDNLPSYGGTAKNYMIPYTVSNVSIFYNKANTVAPTPPKTWDELLANCGKAVAAGIGCIATDGDAMWANTYWYDYLLNRNQGDGSFKKLLEDKTGAAWDDPAVLASAKQIQQLTSKGYLVKGYDASKYPEQQNNWAAGKSLYYLMGSWAPAETKKYAAAGFQYGAFNFPSTTASSSTANDAIVFGFAVPKTAKHVDAAEKFIAFFSAKDQQEGISTVADNLAARPDVAAPAPLADVAQILKDDPSRLPTDGVAGDVGDKAFTPAFTKLFLGQESPEQFVKDGKAAVVTYWKAKS